VEKPNYFFPAFLFIFCALTGYFLIEQPKNTLLVSPQETTPTTTLPSQTPTPTLTPSPSTTPSPTFIPTLTPTPTPTPIPIPTPSPASTSDINSLIDRFATQYGQDPNVIRHIALCESGFNSNAVNGSYLGLFQFGPVTWKNIRQQMGENPDSNLRASAEESIQTAAYALSLGKGGLWPNCLP